VGKRKHGSGKARPSGGDTALVDLLADARVAVERALDEVAAEPGPEGHAVPVGHASPDPAIPCGPAPRRDRSWVPIVDPLLLDRYHGLLTRSGMVGGAVHHLPSRLRERTESALHELIVGVARDRSATGARVDLLTDELLGLIGERIAQRVEEWRDPVDRPGPGGAGVS
jgi:hypothetical protein